MPRWASRAISAAISPIPSEPASSTTGTTSPRSVSVAIPTLTVPWTGGSLVRPRRVELRWLGHDLRERPDEDGQGRDAELPLGRPPAPCSPRFGTSSPAGSRRPPSAIGGGRRAGSPPSDVRADRGARARARVSPSARWSRHVGASERLHVLPRRPPVRPGSGDADRSTPEVLREPADGRGVAAAVSGSRLDRPCAPRTSRAARRRRASRRPRRGASRCGRRTARVPRPSPWPSRSRRRAG